METGYGLTSTSSSSEDSGLVKSLVDFGETALIFGTILTAAVVMTPISFYIERKVRKEMRPEVERQYGRKLSNREYRRIMDERDAHFWHNF